MKIRVVIYSFSNLDGGRYKEKLLVIKISLIKETFKMKVVYNNNILLIFKKGNFYYIYFNNLMNIYL